MTWGGGGSAYSSSTRLARFASTARWWMEPLSVISPMSSDGNSASRMARQMRLDVPLLACSKVSSNRANSARTAGSASKEAMAASAAGRGGTIGGEIGRQLAAGIGIGKHQCGNVVTVRAGQHHVAHQRREMGDESPAQRADADPGPGRELEIFGEAAVEQQAFGRIGRIGELDRVADLVKALVVERVSREMGRLVIAGRDVEAPEPRFELAVARHELELAP